MFFFSRHDILLVKCDIKPYLLNSQHLIFPQKLHPLLLCGDKCDESETLTHTQCAE